MEQGARAPLTKDPMNASIFNVRIILSALSLANVGIRGAREGLQFLVRLLNLKFLGGLAAKR